MHKIVASKLAARLRAMSRERRLEYLANAVLSGAHD
jgi:hypothetical protein